MMLSATVVVGCMVALSTSAATQPRICAEYHYGLTTHGPIATLSHCVRLTCMEGECDMSVRGDILAVLAQCDRLLGTECIMTPRSDSKVACENIVQKYVPGFADNLMLHSNWYRVTCGDPRAAGAQEAARAQQPTTAHSLHARPHPIVGDGAMIDEKALVVKAGSGAPILQPTTTTNNNNITGTKVNTTDQEAPAATPQADAAALTAVAPLGSATESSQVTTSRNIIIICVSAGVAFLVGTVVAVAVVVHKNKKKGTTRRTQGPSLDSLATPFKPDNRKSLGRLKNISNKETHSSQ